MDTEVVQPNNSREITAICDNVTSSVYTINSRVKSLKSALENVGTPKDNPQLRGQIRNWELEAKEKMESSLNDLCKLNQLARVANKQQKLQIDKITSHCKEALEAFCNIQEKVIQKLRLHLMNTSDSSAGPYESNEYNDQVQIQVQKNLEFENQLLLEREKSVKEIEKNIVLVNKIMKELGALVWEQGAAVDTIENRIEASYADVRLANQQLETAAQYQTKSRKRKLILVLILIVVFSILITIIVVSTRS